MRLLRASLVSLLLLCLLTGAVNAQTCPPLQGVQATLEGAQNFCRTSTGGTFTATEYGGGTSTHQWVYGPSGTGPWTPIAGATGTTYQLNGSDFPSTGMFWITVTSTPQCGSPRTAGAQSVNVYDTLPAPDTYGHDQICAGATSAIAQAAALWDSYSWSITHGTLIPGSNGCGDDPTKRCVSFRPDGTGDVHLSLTVTAGSCSSNGVRVVPIVENAPPELYVWTPVCPGGQGGANTSQYPAGVRTWSVTNAHIDADYGDRIIFTPDGNGPVDVTLTFTDSNGCSSSNTGRAQLAGTKPVITLGSPACFTNGTATANGGWDAFDWSITNGTITNGQGTANVSFSGSGSGPMVLTVNGRANFGTFSCTTASDPVTVPTVSTPTITLGTPDICPYGTDTATAPEGYANYWWSVNNGYITAGDGTNSIQFVRGGYPNNPNEPITVSLYVANANGCSGPPATATVPTRTIPSPTITLDTPDICPYGTNTATVPPQYANYWWSVNNGYIVGGDGTNSIRFQRGGYPNNPNDPITITLYVQDANGCPAQQTNVTVPTRTIESPVITLGTPDICPYGTNTATVPAQYANYWWSLNNGYIVSGDGTNSIRFQRGGGYPGPGHENEPITITLYVQDANGCPALQSSVTVPTRSIPAPVITLGTPDICPYGTNTATVPAQYANYWWSLNNGYLQSGDGTNSITFSPGGGMPGSSGGPITITLYAQDANGCPAPQSSVTVPIRTIPAPTITLATPDICKFGTNTATAPAGYANYWWSLNNGYLMSGEGTNSITFRAGSAMPGGTYDPITITLYVQDGNGCPAPQSTVTVPIRNIPAPAITLGTPDICKYGTDTATAPAGYANYWWSLNNGSLISGDGTNSITFSAGSGMPGGTTDPVTITLYVQDGNGCPAPQSTVTVPIRNIPPPTVTLATPDVCLHGSDTASVPAQYAYYSWSITGGSITGGDPISNSITFAPDTMNPGPITLTLSVTDGNGCPVSIEPITIPIRTIPPPVITANGPTSLCGGGSVTLTAPDGFSYTWSNGATTRAITVTQAGDYFVTVNDASGCNATSAPVHVTAATPSPLVITTPHDTTCLYGTILATISNPSLFTNITWSAVGGSIFPNGASSSTEATNGTVSQVSITAHATDVATGCPVSATVVIPIVPLNPPVMTVSSNGPICYGTAVTISIPPQPAGSQIYWDYTGVKLGGGDGQTFITLSAPPSPSFSLRVRLTDPRYCTTQNTITVPVHLPVVPVLQADDRYGCPYAEKTVTVTNPSAYTSYTWSVTNGTIIGPNNQPTVHIGLLGSGVNTDVTFTASDGTCPITAWAGFYSTQPSASISGGSGTYCTGTTTTLSASTDASNATYLWSNGATSNFITASAAAPGPYTVTVTNAYGCSTTSAPVTVHFAPLSTTINASGATTFCAGGSVTLTPAMLGDSYLWSNGATTRTINVTQSGSYSVTVTDASCQFVSPATTVTVNPLPAATITASGPTTFCAGGSVTLTASAGSTYAWSNGATTQAITVSTGGSYSVTVTNASGCSATSAPTVVTVNTNPTANITAYGATTFCAGGSVTLAATSAASYLWSTGETTHSIVASTSGNYSVTVTNENGCSTTSAPTAVTVNANPAATITASGPTTFCAGGNVTLTASSGASYLWSTGATTASIVASTTGSYSVTVTTAAGCSNTSQPLAVTVNALPDATITAPSSVCASTYGDNARVASVFGGSYAWTITGGTITGGAGTYQIAFKPSGSDPVTLGVTVTNASGCAASSTRVVDVHSVPKPAITPSGTASFCNSGLLTAPAGYTAYSWKRDGGQIGGASAQTFLATQSGTYSVIVWDATNCWVESDPVSITVSTTPAASIAAQNNVCAGTTYGAVSDGGAASYQWSVTNGTIVDGQGTNVMHYTTGASGNMTLTLTVANAQGCSDTQSMNISIANVQATITPSGPLTICPGGSVTLTASAGTSYIWSNNTYAQSTTVTQAGSYSVRVFDANGCYAQSQSVTVAVASPSATITPSGPTTFCAGGNVTLSAPAGYSYTWSNGATTQSITVNQSNTYSVTVLDANGCTASSSTTVTVNPLPIATVSGNSAICPGGSATITASLTGSAPWTVTWSDNVTQTINSGTTASRSVNPAATTTYTITSLTDANCTGTSSGSATVTVRPLPTAVVSGSGAICAGASATITAALTGSAPWTVTWSDNVTQTINTGTTASRSVSPAATTTYTVTSLTDANCSGTSSGSATVTVRPLPTAVVSGGGSICPDGSATVTAALTGTAPFTLIWSDNVTQTINSGTTAWRYIGVVATQTFTVTSLTDANCTGTSSGSATVTVRPLPTAAVSGTAAICPGGSATITAALTGTAPFTVIWSDNVTQTINTGMTASRSVSPASATTYTVTSLTDANCTGTSSGSATITVKTLPTAAVSGGSTICPGGSSTITATLTGTTPFTVIWSDNVTQTINSGTTASRSVSPAATTTYTVTSVSDAASCPRAGTGSATVTVKTLPTATVSGGGAICPGASATITAALTGTAPWTVIWSDNVTQTINSGTTATRSVSPAAATTYTVTSVTDASGCAAVAGSGSATVTRSVAASITTQPSNKSTTINTNVTISVVAAGTSPISYQWFKSNGTIVAGATSSSYTTSFPAKGNYQFYVEVWNACNTTHVKSHNVTVQVN